jgi:hypothetical protein
MAIRADFELGFGHRPHGFYAQAWGVFGQQHFAFFELKHCIFGNQGVDLAAGGQREGAGFEHFAAAVTGAVFHRHHDFFRARHQIHRAAHAGHHFAGHHPVG